MQAATAPVSADQQGSEPTGAPAAATTFGVTSTVPFIPECEVLDSEGDSPKTLEVNCTKNPGHVGFFPASEFRSHLPLELQGPKCEEYIQTVCDRTVKIFVKYTSKNRPNTFENSSDPYPYSRFKGSRRKSRCGTGLICSLGEFGESADMVLDKCPCPLCEASEQPRMWYWRVNILTATHVIYDDSEARQAKFVCFYDSDDIEEQENNTLFGMSVSYREGDDRCKVVSITHDKQLSTRIQTLLLPVKSATEVPMIQWHPSVKFTKGFMISHPHGMSKKISFGDFFQYKINMDTKFTPGVASSFTNYICLYLPLSDSNSPSPETTQATDQSLELGAMATSVDGSSSSISSGSDKRENKLIPLKPSTEIKPGHIYMLPFGSTVTIPPDSEYLYTIKRDPPDLDEYLVSYYSLEGFWMNFPPGTVCTLPTGETLNVPAETLFHSDIEKDRFERERCNGHLLYDITTCPGSSGAAVFTEMKDLCHQYHIDTHAGAAGGTNRSGRSWVLRNLFENHYYAI